MAGENRRRKHLEWTFEWLYENSSKARHLHVTKAKWSIFDKLGGTADSTSFVPLRENVFGAYDVFLFSILI